MDRVIHIHPLAPSKPPEGQPCNGCGVCCLAEPCPVGVIVSRRWSGACAALRWSEAAGRYSCGLLGDADWADPKDPRHGGAARQTHARWPHWMRALWRRWARRVIAAGIGCDAAMDVHPFERR